MLDTSKFTYSDSHDNQYSKSNNRINKPYKTSLNKEQFSILTRSFFYSGMSYIFLCLLSIGFVYTFRSINLDAKTYNVLTIVALVALLVCAIISSILISRFLKVAKNSYSVVAYLFSIVSNAFTFGLICSIWGYELLIYSFIAGGLVLILAGLISLSLSKKATYTLSKIYMALGFGLVIIFLASAIIALSMPGFTNWWYFVVYGAFGLYVFIDTIMVIKRIQMISEYQAVENSSNSAQITTISLYAGYILLCSFIQTVWIILSMILRSYINQSR